MLFEDVNRRTWEAYENARKLYFKRPVLYRLKLFFLLFQALVMFLLVIGIVVFLVCLGLRKPTSEGSLQLWIFLAINGVVMIWGYAAMLFNRAWKGTLFLKKSDYPELYRQVNWIAHILRTPEIHRIYISPEFNATVCSKFIFFPGLRRNILILGYPLLCATSSKAFLGCLAHEFGHLAGNHLSWRDVFFRVSVFWSTFQLGFFTLLFHFWRMRFLKALEIAAHSIYYRHEMDADRHIIEKFGPEYAAECLLQLEIREKLLDKDRTLDQLIETKNFREIDFAEVIKGMVRKPLTPEECEKAVARAMRATPPIFDAHPALRDRLAMTGLKNLAKHAMTTPDALEKIVGSSKNFFSAVNEYYRHGVIEKAAAELRAIWKENLRILEGFDPGADYPLGECVKRVNALGALSRGEERRALTRRSCERFPEAADLKCLLLSDRLEAAEDGLEQAEIIAQMEETVRQSPMLIYMVNDALLTHYLQHGETEKIKKFFDFRDDASKRNAKRLSAPLSKDDDLIAAPLNEVRKKMVVDAFSKIKMVRRLYSVERRYDKLMVGTKFLVIQQKSFHLRDPKSIIQELQALFPEHKIVSAKRKFCARHLDVIPGTLVWDSRDGVQGKAFGQSEPGKAS